MTKCEPHIPPRNFYLMKARAIFKRDDLRTVIADVDERVFKKLVEAIACGMQDAAEAAATMASGRWPR